MRPILIALTLLATGATIAQAGTTSDISGCPVNINVNQHGVSKTVWTISEEDARKDSQPTAESDAIGIHVYLRSKTDAEIKQVSLRVFYPQPGLHYLPVAPRSTTTQNALRELKKTFHLTADGGASLHLAGDLLVNQAGGVTRVALMSVVYANGYTWLAGSSRSCSVEPDHFMPVQTK